METADTRGDDEPAGYSVRKLRRDERKIKTEREREGAQEEKTQKRSSRRPDVRVSRRRAKVSGFRGLFRTPNTVHVYNHSASGQ